MLHQEVDAVRLGGYGVVLGRVHDAKAADPHLAAADGALFRPYVPGHLKR
jgi:hypothetical protein